MRRRERADRIREQLEALYGQPAIPLDHTDPFTLLVAVLLSAQTTDKKVNQITPALFDRAPTPAAMAALSVEEIRELIREVGLAPQKAKALIKQLTGGDTITARFLFKEFFDFKPVFKLWLAANHKPTIAGGDAGIWRRIRLVPFTVTIPEAERDPRLAASLLEELPGILAWAVRGCQAWQAEGLGVPDEVRAATAGYREEMDVLAPFLAERTEVASGERVTAAELYQAYEAWCAANGERARSQKGLAAGLRERGFETTRGAKGVRCWIGLRILPVG